MRVKRITIENFRGIKHPLQLEFSKGQKETSVAIYGRNGNGKSSIVDSWEWLYSDGSKIEHLAREGAAEREFPHKSSGGHDCYIHVEFFEDEEFVRQDYNPAKVTQPHKSGNFEKFYNVVKHPCHLRYRDLQTFVYQTKSERYRYLAKYLGFETRLVIQERFIAQRNKYKALVSSFHSRLALSKSKLINLLNLEEDSTISEIQRLSTDKLSKIANQYDINSIANVFESNLIKPRIEEKIKQDPNAIKLTHLKSYERHLSKYTPVPYPIDDLNLLNSLLVEIRNEEENLSKLILLKLYAAGIEIVDSATSICPLCDSTFTGSLNDHIKHKFGKLSILKDQRQEFKSKRLELLNKLKANQRIGEILLSENELDSENPEIKRLANSVVDGYKISVIELSREFEEIENFEESYRFSSLNSEKLSQIVREKLDVIKDEILTLEKDESRLRLANDFKFVNDISSAYEELYESDISIKLLKKRNIDFNQIIDDFIENLKTDIQNAFDKISSNVVTYFNILEASNTNITNPRISLLSDKEKAVELEIEFASELVHPAFKVLSESQINSFGLAVFLAAIRQFNTDFKFVILDDVVNSFDSYKRPKVIDLIKTHFFDFQTLILTHDQIWYDRLQRTFPYWNRIKFTSWDYNTGPKVKPGLSIFEEIEEQLENDKPVIAGQLLGRYLEWTLQEFNQNFEAPLKYRIDNQYALNDLFQAFRDRLVKKLKTDNFCTQKVVEFGENTIFRNYCAHWKGTETDFSQGEIEAIYKSWIEIDNLFKCSECSNYVTIVNPGEYIRCRCSKTNLKDQKYKLT